MSDVRSPGTGGWSVESTVARTMCGAGAMTGIRVSTRDISGIGIGESRTIPYIMTIPNIMI